LRDNRWAQRSAPAYNAESHSSPQLSSVRADSWTARESAWIQPERLVTSVVNYKSVMIISTNVQRMCSNFNGRAATRPIVDIPERWASGTGTGLNPAGRSSAPVAPPPPIYSGVYKLVHHKRRSLKHNTSCSKFLTKFAMIFTDGQLHCNEQSWSRSIILFRYAKL